MTVAIVAFVFAMSRPVFAVTTAPTLGSASTFAVLGASTVTNTGLSVITGDLGVSPGTACTGLPTPCTGNGPGVVTGGTVHAGDAVAAQAHTDLATAYAALKAMQCGTNLTGKDLGGMTLASGVYCFDSSAQLTGTLHVSGVVVFQIGSTLTTASNSFVIVDDNSACGGNVYWQVGSSATLGTGTTFAGNIVALASITITTSATISGRALAVNAAVTMDTNHISACGAGIPTGGPCGENTGTGDNDHHNDKGETGDNDHHHNDSSKHVRDSSLSDQARTSHDSDDSHGHHSHDKGHNDKDDCAKNNDNENHNNHDTDDRTDNAKDNNHD